MSKGAEGSRFAGADIAGDESGEPFLEGKSETSQELTMSPRWEKVVAGDRFGERGETKAIEIIQSGHCFPPDYLFLRNQWATGVG